MAKFVFNNVKIDVFADDISLWERYENAVPILVPLEEMDIENMSPLDMLKIFDQRIGMFFNAVLGDGVWEKIFDKKPKRVTEFIKCFNALKKAMGDTGELEKAAAKLVADAKG